MKRNVMTFYTQLAIVSVLASIGVIALCGEPTEDANFLSVVFGQLVCFALFCGAAYLLGHKWNLSRKMRYLKF